MKLILVQCLCESYRVCEAQQFHPRRIRRLTFERKYPDDDKHLRTKVIMPDMLDQYIALQTEDICAIGGSQMIGAPSAEWVVAMRHPVRAGVREQSDRHFVIWKEGGLDECWVDHTARNYADTFRAFLLGSYGIALEGLLPLALNVDHVHAKKIAAVQGHRFVRLAIINDRVNQSWGSWERMFAVNWADVAGMSKDITWAQTAKIFGIPGPGAHLALQYLTDLNTQLLAYGTYDDESFLGGRDDALNATLSLLIRGLRVPENFKNPLEYMMFELDCFLPNAAENPALTLPRHVGRADLNTWRQHRGGTVLPGEQGFGVID